MPAQRFSMTETVTVIQSHAIAATCREAPKTSGFRPPLLLKADW